MSNGFNEISPLKDDYDIDSVFEVILSVISEKFTKEFIDSFKSIKTLFSDSDYKKLYEKIKQNYDCADYLLSMKSVIKEYLEDISCSELILPYLDDKKNINKIFRKDESFGIEFIKTYLDILEAIKLEKYAIILYFIDNIDEIIESMGNSEVIDFVKREDKLKVLNEYRLNDLFVRAIDDIYFTHINSKESIKKYDKALPNSSFSMDIELLSTKLRNDMIKLFEEVSKRFTNPYEIIGAMYISNPINETDEYTRLINEFINYREYISNLMIADLYCFYQTHDDDTFIKEYVTSAVKSPGHYYDITDAQFIYMLPLFINICYNHNKRIISYGSLEENDKNEIDGLDPCYKYELNL